MKYRYITYLLSYSVTSLDQSDKNFIENLV